jgi:hypothetical protein
METNISFNFVGKEVVLFIFVGTNFSGMGEMNTSVDI